MTRWRLARLRWRWAVAAALAAFVTAARADEWPLRPIRAIAPLSAGSAVDVIPRIVFEQLSQHLGQSIVVENRPGGSGTVAARAVTTADPDGYTILVHSSALVIAPSTVANVPYDPVTDLAAVAPLGDLPSVLVVSPSKGIRTVQELVALGKRSPVMFGSIGVASPVQLAMERLRRSAGLNAQPVLFRGAPEALLEAMTGRIDAYYSPLLPALPLIRDGKLVPLVVSSPRRSPQLPDVPTSEEAGYPNSTYSFWIGVFAPAKTPRPIVERLNGEIERSLQAPAVADAFSRLGVAPMTMDPQHFADFVRHELTINTELVKAAGIAAE